MRVLKKQINLKAEGKTRDITQFYHHVLETLHNESVNFMIGGGFAMLHYTGILRDKKDLDIFCKASQYPKILKILADKGYKTELTDVRWLAKIFNNKDYIDIIFDTVNNICTVDDSWFERAQSGTVQGMPVKFIPLEELIWCKIYVQNRERYDGADVNHLMLKQGHQLDWNHLLVRLDRHWHLLLTQILLFQFVYPADYHQIIPRWIFDTLIERAQEQYEIPPAVEKVCRGPIIDQTQYEIDIKEWNYKVSTIKTT
jgi:predicted nucleotidyltransferase